MGPGAPLQKIENPYLEEKMTGEKWVALLRNDARIEGKQADQGSTRYRGKVG